MNNATYPRSKETAAREEKRIHRAILGLRTNFGSPWERYFRVFHDTLNTVGLWFSSTLTRNTEVQRSGLFKPRLWFLDTALFQTVHWPSVFLDLCPILYIAFLLIFAPISFTAMYPWGYIIVPVSEICPFMACV